jgi:alpha-beta hydrolase superfamily lysophospholipase
VEQPELVVLDARHARHRARSLVAVMVSFALAGLTACSDDGPSGLNPTPSATAPATTTSAPPDGTSSPTSAPATSPVPDGTDPPTSDPVTTSDPASPSTTLVAPPGDDFYTPPDPLPGSTNGDLIWARPIEPPPIGTTAWLVLYRSESVGGDPVAVSGVVVAPASDAGAARPVLSWAHGTTGLADRCAPSKTFGSTSEALLASAIVALGFTYVATDYEGLGTPGVHPYLVGQSEGRGVLDIVRAAAQLAGTGVDAASPVAIFGHSQGGHAALMAGELAATYAPELDVVGTVAGAPPGDIALIERGTGAASGFAGGGFGLMLDAGFAAAYPDLPADALVTEEGLDVLAAAADTCTAEAFGLAEASPDIQRDGTEDAGWQAVFEANSPGGVAPSAPVLILHGSADNVVPPILSELIEADYCQLGVTVQRTVYEGADHGSVLAQGFAEVQTWIMARLNGEPPPTSC